MNHLFTTCSCSSVSACLAEVLSAWLLLGTAVRSEQGKLGAAGGSPRTQRSQWQSCLREVVQSLGHRAVSSHFWLCCQTCSVLVHQLLQKLFSPRAGRASISAKTVSLQLSPKRRALSAEIKHQWDKQDVCSFPLKVLCFQEGCGCHLIIKSWKIICILRWRLQ